MERELIVKSCRLRGKDKFFCLLPTGSTKPGGRLLDSDTIGQLYHRLWALEGNNWRSFVRLHPAAIIETETRIESSSDSSSDNGDEDDPMETCMLKQVTIVQLTVCEGPRKYKIMGFKGGFWTFGRTKKEVCRKALEKCLKYNLNWKHALKLNASE